MHLSLPTSVPPHRSRRVWLIAAASVIALGLVGAGAAWGFAALNTPEPDAAAPSASAAAPTPSPTPSLRDRVLAGPPVYIGDELSWFLFDQAEMSSFFPDAANVRTGSLVFTIGEGEGVYTEPQECLDWLLRMERGVVGTRSLAWSLPSLGEDAGGRMYARQFPDGGFAADEFARYAAAGEACASFEVLLHDAVLYARHSVTVTAQNEFGLVVEHRSDAGHWVPGGVQTRAVVLEGNVVVTLDVDHAEGDQVDGAALLSALQERAAQARQSLTEEIGYR